MPTEGKNENSCSVDDETEKVAMERIYQSIIGLGISDVVGLKQFTDNSLKQLGVSSVLEMNDIIEKHIELVKLYLDSQRS